MPQQKPDIPLHERFVLSIPNAAALADVSIDTIRRAVRNGTLPHFKPLGMDAIRIRTADLFAWLEQRTAA